MLLFNYSYFFITSVFYHFLQLRFSSGENWSPEKWNTQHYKFQNAFLHPTHYDVIAQRRGVHIFAAHILFTTFIYLFYFFLPQRQNMESGICGHLCDVIDAGG